MFAVDPLNCRLAPRRITVSLRLVISGKHLFLIIFSFFFVVACLLIILLLVDIYICVKLWNFIIMVRGRKDLKLVRKEVKKVFSLPWGQYY